MIFYDNNLQYSANRGSINNEKCLMTGMLTAECCILEFAPGMRDGSVLGLRKRLQDVFETYSKIMLSAAYGIVGNQADAEDAVQDAFEKLLRYPDKIQSIPFDDLKAYLTIVSKNAAIDILNKQKIEVLPNDEIGDFIFPAENRVFEANERLENEDAFKLPDMKPIYRDVLVLIYYYDLPVSRVAEILNTTEDNVRVRLHRALEQLREKERAI